MAGTKSEERVSNRTLGMLLGAMLGVGFLWWVLGTGGVWNVQPGRPDVGWLRYQLPLIAVPMAEVCGLGGLIAVMRFRALRRTLGTRAKSRRAWLPADPCDPTEAQVERLGRQVAQIPQPVQHWLDFEATGFRIGMRSTGQGRVLLVVEGADRMSAGMRTALGTIPDAELIPLDQLEALGIRLPPESTWAPGRAVGYGEQVDE